LNISQGKNFKINKNKSLRKNKTIDINNNKIIDDFLSDKNITNKNDEFLFDTNNNYNNKNLEMKRIKTTYDNTLSIEFKNENNNSNSKNLNNNNILQKLIIRIKGIEKKILIIQKYHF